MKLAVDTHHLLLEDAGTKRVTVNLLQQFAKSPGINLIELSPPYPILRGKGLLGKTWGYLIRLFWIHIHLPLQCVYYKADLLLSPEYNTPLFTHCKRAVIVHDANIRAQKEFISPAWFYCYYIPFIEAAIKRADLIFTVSQFSKKQLIELMHLNESKIHVAYNGIDESFTNEIQDDTHTGKILPSNLVKDAYILFVGTFEARKNIERLIEAFALFKKRQGKNGHAIKLAIAGKPSSGRFSDRNMKINNLIKELRLESEIVLCGYVSDNDLPELYRNAAIIAFPSLYEGFGLPIIEGFASGVPVLTSNVCSMPEIAGNAALLVDPYNVNDISDNLEMLMFNQPLREQLITAGYERVKQFTWKICVEHMLLNIKSILPIK